MDFSSQPQVASLSAALAVLASSSAAALASSNAFVLSWPQPIDGDHTLFNPTNSLLLQPFFDVVTTDFTASIVSLSYTHHIISLKLTNTNYLYCRMQMKPYLLGQGVFSFVDGSNFCPSPHVLAADGTSL
jgi:hypothetical protein